MEVTYILNREDYGQFHKYVFGNRGRGAFLRGRVKIAVFLTAGVFGFVLSAFGNKLPILADHFVAIALTACVTAAAILLLYGLAVRRVFANLPAESPSLLGDYTIGIGPGGVRARTPGFEGLCFWKGFKEIVDDKQHIYLMSASIMGAIIPKRAFATAQDAQEFLRLAIAYWKSATGR